MKLKSVSSALVGMVAALIAFSALIVLLGLMVKPNMSAAPASHSPQEVQAVQQSRAMKIDPDKPVRLQVPVDYSQGSRGKWYPKGESPMLADLVKQGKLPPVAERVGPEPVVIQGPDGVGQYGGTWVRMSDPFRTIVVVGCRLSYTTLIRFGPQGPPLVPHVAKSYEASPDNKEFTFHLRKGMKWSDGHPFTADDILFWWVDECNNKAVRGTPPAIMKIKGKVGDIKKIDDYTVKFTFPEAYGTFLAKVASWEGELMLASPAHYLRQFHPTLGDKGVIERWMRARRLRKPDDVYSDVKDELNAMNPEHPRLWPWVYKTYKASPPQALVRNPYYFAVDAEGNQLPYIDRLSFEVKSPKMATEALANGEASQQDRGIKWDQYTMLMQSRQTGKFHILHWYQGDRSDYCIYPNLNRRYTDQNGVVDQDAQQKAKLLGDKRFRQALSLAIDRKEIIRADYDNVTEPAQAAPGPASYFYYEKLYHSFTEYDPNRANRILDEMGLTARDLEGYRKLPNGHEMTLLMNFTTFTGIGPGQFIVDDWAKIGIRLVIRELANNLYYSEKAALKPDFTVWSSNGEYYPLIEPRVFMPYSDESNYAQGWAMWYVRGGLYGDPSADPSVCPGSIPPPEGHPIRKAMLTYDRTMAESDPTRQKGVFQECQEIAAENLWTINVCTPPPTIAVVKDGLCNVPETLVYSWDFQSPGNGAVEAWYFDMKDHPEFGNKPETTAFAQQEILKATPPPDAPAVEAAGGAAQAASGAAGAKIAAIVKYSFAMLVCLLVALVALRHPYIGRRLLIMVPTLLVISIVVFVIIQLPPGNFVATRIMELQQSGDQADVNQIHKLEEMFFLKEYSRDNPNVWREVSSFERYCRWMGLYWFASLDQKDEGLLQGYLGRSMESQESVNLLIGDRLLLTVLISLGTILLTWVLAIPAGIYSAVKQYSIGDYVFTFLGFIGMCVPGFLLALLLIYFSTKALGEPVSGLFSSRFGSQVGWDWPKVLDLLKHIWIPIVVIGVGGTAWMIRVMRANLLDELRKPYVVTALAKGVRPLKLLLKYPVRMALNPFISGIGGLFPQIVSGEAIVAIVLSLPTIGPRMLDALMAEDMYLAGSLLMVLSLLGVVGTLVSDLLLLWLDPRIRMQGGSR